MSNIDAILEQIDANLPVSVERFMRFLAFPSISSQPEGKEGIVACAVWLRSELESLGFEARIVRTSGHPVVLGMSRSGSGSPGILLYGHYDVQPVEPLDAWTAPPFEPAFRDEDGLRRIYARGASDSKSQVWSFIEALRAWKDTEGAIPVDVTVLLEGEEETGSPSLPAFVDAYRDELACDVAYISDSDMWSPTRPAITTRLKGLLHEKITIVAPNNDLHSGQFGNVAVNPLRVLTKVLASIHDDHGRVTIDGFYDGVTPLPTELREQWAALPVDEALAGVSVSGGSDEGGYGTIESMWGRPGIDFNGIVGGNTGSGERSVLPSSASARLSFRLVGEQKPEYIRRIFRNFVKGRLPPGCRVEFEGSGGNAAVSVNEDSPYLMATARALDAEWPERTLIKGTGGTVPLVRLLTDRLGVDCIVTGFILADDAIHGPNEHYDVERLRKGTRSWARILSELRDEKRQSP
ncbi:MAG TPA: M20/M25/M40 family metallo-hydrolase [Mesorhizobium sp.]|jgi:acetylornithine deacetylase/succinyl-diaminopimelate desuccinylase-like protein|uniref:M20/M25/M40 family metallo-hydrolase n=1 Tax=Mesorhizobium sp. TaxID=1871066 RepID=UPI002DDD3513|nr:M20/M25/M40 family metallo-hydrolase [Mesorhizobium sp.]HEV2507866.1 M20/M25/M40 family metallo-hydrolase [Mesorhizobium sp.]